MIARIEAWFRQVVDIVRIIAGMVWDVIGPTCRRIWQPTRYVAVGWGIWIASIVMVIAIREYLNRHRFRIGDPNDARLLFAASVVLAYVLIYMVAKTKPWTVLAAGAFWIIFFGGGLYALTSQNAIWHWHTPTDNDLNWLRAALFVGAVLLFPSYIWLTIRDIRDWRRKRRAKRIAASSEPQND